MHRSRPGWRHSPATGSYHRTLAVAAVLLAACGPSTSEPTPAPAAGTDDRPLLVSTRCADVVVLGARGSLQSATKNRGVGAEVLASVEALSRQVHSRSATTFRVEAVHFDAAGADYQAAVIAGAADARKRLDTLVAVCPRSRLALVGFSQGAQVVHGTAVHVPTALARHIVLVAMIADPRRNPVDAINHWSYGTRAGKPGRLGAGTPIDIDLRSVSIDLCVADDEICNAHGSPGAPPSRIHREFYEQPSTARSTARQLDRVLRRRG